MPLVNTERMLKDAQKNGYAIGAFNAENMEMVQAIVEAAQELHSPVIIQTTPSTIRYGGAGFFYSNARAAAEAADVPVALHLDHGDSFALASQAMRSGYTSVMIDGSLLPLEENIALTVKVVEMCRPNGVPVEAELGTVGGKEDDTVASGPQYTDPETARIFAEKTGISSLAVAIGTAHGFYKGKPVLKKELLSEIHRTVEIPLVLHGASGIPDEDVRDCISRGICKVNFATELRVVFTSKTAEILRGTPGIYDPKKYLGLAREAVKELVKHKITVCTG